MRQGLVTFNLFQTNQSQIQAWSFLGQSNRWAPRRSSLV